MSEKCIDPTNRIPPNNVIIVGAHWNINERMYYYHFIYTIENDCIDTSTQYEENNDSKDSIKEITKKVIEENDEILKRLNDDYITNFNSFRNF